MSNKKLVGMIGGCIIVVIAIVTIATLSAKPPEQGTDYSTLLYYLRDSGASIGEERESHVPFFGIEGRSVTVNESPIQVFEYAYAEAMESEASRVSSDGFTVRKENSIMSVGWIGPPHFYRAGRIIVIYIGDNDSIINLLQNALGKQFAGMFYSGDVIPDLWQA